MKCTEKNNSLLLTEYLHSVKTIADEFSLIDAPLSQDEITLYVLHGLGTGF
jgi:hypothetical protein